MDTDTILQLAICGWALTLLFGFSITISYPFFKKLYDKPIEIIIPFFNILELLHVVGSSPLLGFLALIPGINLLLFMLIGAKLKNIIKTSVLLEAGLIFFPILFIPIVAYSNPTIKGKEDSKEEEKEKEKTEEVIEEEEDEGPKVDEDGLDESIFRLKTIKKENLIFEDKPYKAKKSDLNQSVIDSEPAEEEFIERADKKEE